jgi:cysteinyl-tRNA synthetase
MFRLYDTRTRQVQAIEPAQRRLLRIYDCGPAAYRYAHIGDLRPCLLADLIRRNAEHRHHLAVLTCQNIDDATQAAGDGAACGHAADGQARAAEEAFRADCTALNLRPAEHSPRASEQIGLVVETIAGLIETGHAYPAPDGSVYFDARSFPGLGELSGNPPAGLGPGGQEGGKAAEAGGPARSGADWALWSGAPAGREPAAWPAPWGTGFPAWAAECSALSRHYLGDHIDIHTGGIDLRYPHHERERAQSDAAAGHEMVRHWVHGEQLGFDGRTMAGPAGNAVLLADLTGRGLDPLALRLAFLSGHYREPMNLTWDALSAADQTLRRWRELVAQWAYSPSKPVHAVTAGQVAAAFDDDLDTPAALRSLHQLEQDPEVAPGAKFESFAHADQLLGLDLARDIGRVPAPPAQRNSSPA